MRKYRYEVWGRGQFPEDMLRYDQAEIVSQHKADKDLIYVIQGNVKPTIGRWKSFLWNVNNIELVR